MSKAKTNAMRQLDQQKIPYQALVYDTEDGKLDGISVAAKIERDPSVVYKTLIGQGPTRTPYVFMIPVEAELDLKQAAKVSGEKKIDMLPVKEIESYTGYIRGGCSPIGMRKTYKTFLDESAASHPSIIISGGRIGTQIELETAHLQTIIKTEWAAIKKD